MGPAWRAPPSRVSGPRPRSVLRQFNQFQHGSEARERPSAPDGAETVFGYVKFDPTATDHIMRQQLLSTAALNQLMQGGAQQITPFPSSALSLKSAFSR